MNDKPLHPFTQRLLTQFRARLLEVGTRVFADVRDVPFADALSDEQVILAALALAQATFNGLENPLATALEAAILTSEDLDRLEADDWMATHD